MSNIVKFMHSGQVGAPSLTGLAGSLVSLLDACLVNGYNLKPVQGIVRSGQTATVTCNGHGNVVDQVLLQSGFDQAEYNGEFRISNVTTNTYDITVTGTPATPGTGASMACKVAPLGWEKPFAGANKGAYRSANPQSNRLFLRVDDAATLYAAVHGAAAMTAVDNGVGIWPIPSGYADTVFQQRALWRKSYSADSTVRGWVLIGDDQTFYLLTYWHPSSTGVGSLAMFGDFAPLASGDAYASLLIGENNASASTPSNPGNYCSVCSINSASSLSTAQDGLWLAKSFSGVGATGVGVANIGLAYSHDSGTDNTNAPLQNYPAPVDGAMHLHPVYIQEASVGLRGRYRGLLQVLHKNIGDLNKVVIDNLLGGGKAIILGVGQTYNGKVFMALDLTGPWS